MEFLIKDDYKFGEPYMHMNECIVKIPYFQKLTGVFPDTTQILNNENLLRANLLNVI